MDARSISRTALQHVGGFAVGTLVVVAQALRVAVFAVLAVCAPVVRWVLTMGSMGLFLTCGFYAVVAPHSGFPQGILLGIAVGAAVLLALYEMVLRALEP